jgi:hypothetical protein
MDREKLEKYIEMGLLLTGVVIFGFIVYVVVLMSSAIVQTIF